MANMSKENKNDNDLINQIADLGDITIDKDRRWSIEFDDYGIQGVINALKKPFVDKVCKVVSNWLMVNSNLDVSDICDLEDALREEFK